MIWLVAGLGLFVGMIFGVILARPVENPHRADLPVRLRNAARYLSGWEYTNWPGGWPDSDDFGPDVDSLLREAADEIERQRGEIREILDRDAEWRALHR